MLYQIKNLSQYKDMIILHINLFDIANSIAQKRGGKCLSTEYVDANTQMLWTLYLIKNMGRWCSQCADNFPCGLSEAKEIAHSKGGMCLSTEYTNLCVPMQWMCNKGHK